MLNDIIQGTIVAFVALFAGFCIWAVVTLITNTIEEADDICKNGANFPSEILECNKKSLEKAKPHQILYLYDINSTNFKEAYSINHLIYFFGNPMYSDDVPLKYKKAVEYVNKNKIEQMREKLLNANQKELDMAKQKEQSEINRLKNKFKNL